MAVISTRAAGGATAVVLPLSPIEIACWTLLGLPVKPMVLVFPGYTPQDRIRRMQAAP